MLVYGIMDTFQEHPLLRPIPQERPGDKPHERGVGRVFRRLAQLAFGRSIVALVDADYAAHAVLAEQSRTAYRDPADRRPRPEVFQVPQSGPAVLDGRLAGNGTAWRGGAPDVAPVHVELPSAGTARHSQGPF